MGVFIANFQSPKELIDLIDRYERDKLTNLDHVLRFPETPSTEWTVSKEAKTGDYVLFMCAKTSSDHMSRVYIEAKKNRDSALLNFALAKRELYRQYAGNIMAIGILAEDPFEADCKYAHAPWKIPWYGKVHKLTLLQNPIHISQFREYIRVSRTGTITNLNDEQWSELKTVIERNNPNLNL